MGLTANVRGKRREFLIGLIAPQGGRKQEMPLQTHTHTHTWSLHRARADRQAGRDGLGRAEGKRVGVRRWSFKAKSRLSWNSTPTRTCRENECASSKRMRRARERERERGRREKGRKRKREEKRAKLIPRITKNKARRWYAVL